MTYYHRKKAEQIRNQPSKQLCLVEKTRHRVLPECSTRNVHLRLRNLSRGERTADVAVCNSAVFTVSHCLHSELVTQSGAWHGKLATRYF